MKRSANDAGRRISAVGAAVFISGCLVSVAPVFGSEAKPSNGGFAILKDDASRAQLFKKVEAEEKVKIIEANPGQKFIPYKFQFPLDTTHDTKLGVDRRDVFFGIDISHYTGNIKFSTLRTLNNVSFVYAKATQGTSYADGKFASFYKSLRSLPEPQRVKIGAYGFLSSIGNGADQGNRFVDYVLAHGGFEDGDMPPVVDLEWDITSKGGPDRWKGTKPSAIVDSVLGWARAVKVRTHREPLIYTARAWLKERGFSQEDIGRLGEFRIWTADYSQSGRGLEDPGSVLGLNWSIWQFSDKSNLKAGYKGFLDANIFKGTADQFQEFSSR